MAPFTRHIWSILVFETNDYTPSHIMRIALLLSLQATFLFSTLQAQDWNTIHNFNNPSLTLQDVYHVDESTAYVIGAMYNGTALNVKKTYDGGVTWEEQYTGQVGNNFRQLDSPNNGLDMFAVANQGVLIHSNDGGTIWNSIDIGLSDNNLRDIFFLSTTIGYLTADDAVIYKTSDGGMTWNNLNATIEGVGTVSHIHFIDEQHGFIGGFNYFKETVDGGSTWSDVPGYEPQPFSTIFQVQEITFYTALRGYVSGDVGFFLRTLDGGLTWENLTVTVGGQPIESLMDFEFLESDPMIGFACGYHGVLIRTSDGGVSWEFMSSDLPNTNGLDGTTFPSMEFYGNKGYMTGHSGEVLKYEYIATSISESDRLSLQLFPSPVSEILNIRGLPNDVTEIQLIDANGSLVKRSIDGSQEQISCNELDAGVYILKVLTNDRVISKAFVKE